MTVAWLLAQVRAGVTDDADAWPIKGTGMFRWATDEFARVRVEGTTSDGRTVEVRAADLGLESYELDLWVQRRVGALPGDPQPGSLASLAGTWNQRHHAMELVALRVFVERFELPVGSQPPNSAVWFTWTAS